MVLFAALGMGSWLIQAQLEATELAAEPHGGESVSRGESVSGEAAGG
jgi:hypothetical protein